MANRKITAKTKRVKVSLTFDEIHLIDDALWLLSAQMLQKKEKDPGAEAHRQERIKVWDRLREGRILPMANRWYEARRKAEDLAEKEA